MNYVLNVYTLNLIRELYFNIFKPNLYNVKSQVYIEQIYYYTIKTIIIIMYINVFISQVFMK